MVEQSTVSATKNSNPIAIEISMKHTGARVSDWKLAIVPVKVKSVKSIQII